MVNVGWTILSVGTAILIGIIVIWRMLQPKKFKYSLQKEKNFSQELMTLGSSLVVLGIVFGTDWLIGYSFVGAGVLLSIISVINSRRKEQGSSLEMR